MASSICSEENSSAGSALFSSSYVRLPLFFPLATSFLRIWARVSFWTSSEEESSYSSAFSFTGDGLALEEDLGEDFGVFFGSTFCPDSFLDFVAAFFTVLDTFLVSFLALVSFFAGFLTALAGFLTTFLHFGMTKIAKIMQKYRRILLKYTFYFFLF